MLNILKLIYYAKTQMSLKENQSSFLRNRPINSLKRCGFFISPNAEQYKPIDLRHRRKWLVREIRCAWLRFKCMKIFLWIGPNEQNVVKSSTPSTVITHYWKTDSFRLLLRIFSFSCWYISQRKIFTLLNHNRSRIRFKLHAFLMCVVFVDWEESYKRYTTM